MGIGNRILIGCAGLLGASGVAVGAVGAHLAGGDFARLSSEFLLFHAAAIPGVASWQHRSPRVALIAGGLLAAGSVLFSGDLAMLAFAGVHPIPGLAPVGGLMLIAGWIAVAVSALTAVAD